MEVNRRRDIPEGLTESEYRSQVVKAAVSSTIGTAIERYDLTVIATAMLEDRSRADITAAETYARKPVGAR